MGFSLTRDPDIQWEIGSRTIDDTVEAMRDNLRNRGIGDGEAMESFVNGERAKLQEQLSRNIEGDFSVGYQIPDFDAVAAELSGTENMNDVDGDVDLDCIAEIQDTMDLGSAGENDNIEFLDDVPDGLSDAEIDDVCSDIGDNI